MKLSILVPSVHTRRYTFLPRSTEMLFGQYENLSPDLQDEVEILYLIDNKKMMLGTKRNIMIDVCQGEYISFVDDDDRITDDYIVSLLSATKHNADVIVFKAEVTINGGKPKICHYSKEYEDHNTPEAYYRSPNQVCCFKKSIAQLVEYPTIVYGEDAPYAKEIKKHIKTEHKIDKVLYYYDYSSDTSEPQSFIQSHYRRSHGN